MAACAAALVALAAVAGLWAADRGVERPSSAATSAKALALGPMRVGVPSEWQRLPAGAARIPALERGSALVFDPAPGLSMRFILTLAPLGSDASSSLIPEALLAVAARPPRRPVASRVDGRRAWTYTGMALRRADETMDVTVVPTTAGVLSVACLAPGFASAVARDCASAVHLQLANQRALAPSRDLAFRLRLPRVVRRLDRVRLRTRAALRSARWPRGQAQEAAALAAAHTEAARELSPLAGTRRAKRAVAALRRASPAYQALAAAATARDRTSFALAARRVDRADAGLGPALRGLERP